MNEPASQGEGTPLAKEDQIADIAQKGHRIDPGEAVAVTSL